MRVAVFGCGYVGLTTAVGLAEMGNEVTGIDTDSKKLRSLLRGCVPFYEPALQELLRKNIKEKRLSFSADAKAGIESGDIIFSAVGTPALKSNNADLSAVLKVAEAFGRFGGDGKIFIIKSTVPVGTSEQIRKTIEKHSPGGGRGNVSGKARGKFNFSVVSNPEFLREGSAVQDFFVPDRIVIGLEKENVRLKKTLKTLYRPITGNGVPLVFTDIRSAEVIKYASNAYLATRVSFINELANFCEKAGADIKKVAKGMGLDKRIGTHYLEAGIGYGGSCLPKDLNALIEIGRSHGHDFEVLKAVRAVNNGQVARMVAKLAHRLGGLEGKTVAVWGTAFKSRTDDMRDAPSVRIIEKLLQHRVKVRVYDPAALINARKIFGSRISFSNNYYSVLARADALIICTDWSEFGNPDYRKMRSLMEGNYILDGRNMLDPAEAAEDGFEYDGVGQGLH
jgi:UDPglucose 6-dehydrogenase